MSNVLLEMIEAQAAKTPDAPALMEMGRETASYRDLMRVTRLHMVSLSKLDGAGPIRVATLLPACADTGVFILACCCAATAMPINPVLSDAEVADLMRDGGATHLAADRETATRAGPIAATLGIPLIVLAPDETGIAGSATASFEDADEVRIGEESGQFDRGASETALVLFTSGSTDRPKRVPLSLANLVAGSHNVAGSVGLTSSDIALSMMPMVHVGGLVDMFTAVLSTGGAVAFAGQVSAESFFAALMAFRPTWFQAVPAVLAEIMRCGASEAEMNAMQGLRFIRAVAQPLLNGQHLAFEQRFGVPLVPMYGMTEATGVIASSMPGSKILPGTVGRPFGTEVAIVDTYGNPAPTGAVGEVLVAGPAVTAGYEDQDRATSFRGRWLCTGDQGFLDAEGVLTLVGRIKELINKGGEKISPLEIERAVTLHPAIAEVAAFALPHASLGEDVALAVVPQPGQMIDLPSLQSFLRGSLAEYKLPRTLLLVERLPRVPNGKLDRRALPALADAAASQPAAKTPPRTDTEKTLAALWTEVLDGETPHLEDDFFELGGDSLSATNLATLIEKRFSAVTATGDLFLAPTLGEMARRLDTGTAESGSGKLRPDLEKALRKAMVSWRGSRQDGSVAVTRNAMGGKTPFFWICQSRWQFEPLSEHLSPDRPLHVLSSLSNTGLKNHANTEVLARHYAGWIVSQIPAGPIHLGGFCQGGHVAHRVATVLDSMGRRPDVLCLQDRFVPKPYSGAMALFSGRRGVYSLFDRFLEPMSGWGGYCHGPVSFHAIDADHDDLHKEPHVASFGACLEAVLDAVEAGLQMPGAVALRPRAPLDTALHAAVVEARLPRFMRPGSAQRLPVRVRNLSNVTLPPTAESGVLVAAVWRAFDPQEDHKLGGSAVLETALPPGAHMDVELNLRMPMRGLPVRLSVDLVEDGVSWFYEHRPTPARRLVFPFPPL